jgi:tetratricopeptide (TPR) repeat protein
MVKIERVCGGTPHTQGYTDSKGRFQFQLDSPVGGEADASDQRAGMGGLGSNNRLSSGSSRTSNLAGCDLRAVLPGFFSGTVSLSNQMSFDNYDVGIIVIKRAGNVEGTTISMSSLNAPKDAVKAFEKGRELLKKEKEDEAERSFQKAVELYPKYATAWYQLGLLQTRAHVDQAETSFNKAIEADPKFVSPYLSLALISVRAQQWQKALDYSDAVVKLNPADFPQAHFFKAVAQYNLRQVVEAEKTVRKAIDVDIRHEYPQSEKLLAQILAQHNDLPGAVEHLHKYLALAPNATDSMEIRSQLAEMEKRSVAIK